MTARQSTHRNTTNGTNVGQAGHMRTSCMIETVQKKPSHPSYGQTLSGATDECECGVLEAVVTQVLSVIR
jgi:hypothetical protein